MGGVVLRPVAGERPQLAGEVDLAPTHLAYFVSALACEDETLDDPAEGPSSLLGGPPDGAQFVV
jgi:hypothetical protein